jgi:hypothetical protein
MSLIGLLVLLVICAIVYWIVATLLPLPQPFKNIILAVLGIILIVYLLNSFGVWGGGEHSIRIR